MTPYNTCGLVTKFPKRPVKQGRVWYFWVNEPGCVEDKNYWQTIMVVLAVTKIADGGNRMNNVFVLTRNYFLNPICWSFLLRHQQANIVVLGKLCRLNFDNVPAPLVLSVNQKEWFRFAIVFYFILMCLKLNNIMTLWCAVYLSLLWRQSAVLNGLNCTCLLTDAELESRCQMMNA